MGDRVRHLLSLKHLTAPDIDWIVDRALVLSLGEHSVQSLAGAIVGTLFTLPSTRTRTAFTVAALRLGANVVTYGPADLQRSTGETVGDTATVLAQMLDAFVVRDASPSDQIKDYASHDTMAVINAMSADEHPTQAIADLVTLRQQFPDRRDLDVLYLGEANSTVTALARALALGGGRLHLRTPAGYGLDSRVDAADFAGVDERHDTDDLPTAIDVVYTTQWMTTGTAKPDTDWRASFAPFQVDAKLLNRWPTAVFLHDLPARRGDEVTAEVLDGPRSLAFRQAGNKLFAAMAVLEWCLAYT